MTWLPRLRRWLPRPGSVAPWTTRPCSRILFGGATLHFGSAMPPTFPGRRLLGIRRVLSCRRLRLVYDAPLTAPPSTAFCFFRNVAAGFPSMAFLCKRIVFGAA
eukprot:5598135-Pyramimonas_sp.AAC.1